VEHRQRCPEPEAGRKQGKIAPPPNRSILVDAHSHLDRYGDELPSVLVEIAERRILTFSNSMDLPSYERNVEISRSCKLVLPTFGVHPWNAPEYADRLDELRQAIERSPMLGEIGLDYHFVKDRSQYDAQRKVLDFFLAAAAEQDKIITLHTKGAEEEIVRLLDQHRISRAIVHWYSGPLDALQELVERGCYFTVGVELLRSDYIRGVARRIPSDRILTETDNPGGHQWLVGEPGMPNLLDDVIEALSRAKGMTSETIRGLVWTNVAKLAEGDPWYSTLKEAARRGTVQRES
jgi:TatD DNase family protein